MTVSATTSHDLGVTGPLINGVWLDKTSLGTMDHINPTTARVNGTVLLSGPEEIDAAVAAAKSAYPQWRDPSPDKRRRLPPRPGELIEAPKPPPGRPPPPQNGSPLATAGGPA